MLINGKIKKNMSHTFGIWVPSGVTLGFAGPDIYSRVILVWLGTLGVAILLVHLVAITIALLHTVLARVTV